RRKLSGQRLSKSDFEAILDEVVGHRYSKVELSMFVLACALRQLDTQEIIDFTEAMISTGRRLDVGEGPIADKHCVGGVPGNRTTMIVVPILASLGVTIPKTSSRAITSPAGTADTMGVLANVALSVEEMQRIVSDTGGCIAWGGALDLAPADDILITVERPMALDTEAQMVASILAKKKTAGATHALIDIPVGDTAKIRTREEAEFLGSLFTTVSQAIGIEIEVAITEAHGPIGFGIGPRLEALDVLSVLRSDPEAPMDLREKSLFLAARILERVGSASNASGYRQAQDALDSGEALSKFEEIRIAQGKRDIPGAAPFRREICAASDGRIRGIDCWAIAKVAKLAGAPGNPSAGVLLRQCVGDVVVKGQPVYEIHAQSETQQEFAQEYVDANPEIIQLGY
ncbi:MAG: thymidine phosphorylase, partial [Deltaproteobacteria bacterium]|nr:thymidine phosphorylase [Deltaproteobacteria bacterium]